MVSKLGSRWREEDTGGLAMEGVSPRRSRSSGSWWMRHEHQPRNGVIHLIVELAKLNVGVRCRMVKGSNCRSNVNATGKCGIARLAAYIFSIAPAFELQLALLRGKLVCERRAESGTRRIESRELNLRHELRGKLHL